MKSTIKRDNESTRDRIKINAYRVFGDRLNDIKKKKKKYFEIIFHYKIDINVCRKCRRKSSKARFH